MAKPQNKSRCWKGYKPAPNKKPFSKGSCVKESFSDYVKRNDELLESVQPDTKLYEWMALNEATATRYSVEANFRSRIPEVLEAFAKIALGYVSAAMKQSGYHVKHVFDVKPLRILISSRNWDDGEWISVCSFNPQHDGGSFIISKGFYNRDKRSVSIQSNKKANGNSAAEITVELRNLMHQVANEKDRRQEKLNPIQLKRGPKS